jgi:hypothetical protein
MTGLLPRITGFTRLGSWTREAACAGHPDPTIFDAPDPARDVPMNVQRRNARKAADTCTACPVKAECLQDALDNRHTGVRGGLLIPNHPLRPPAA